MWNKQKNHDKNEIEKERKWDRKEKKVKRKREQIRKKKGASKEKGRKKKKNKLLSWKTNMLLKRDDFQLFFEKNSLIITSFWKMCLHLKGECCWGYVYWNDRRGHREKNN